MIKGYKAKELNTELKTIARNLSDNYEKMRQISEKRFKASLAPGQIFHPRSGFYDNTIREQFARDCEKVRAEAHRLLDDVTVKLTDQATEAPTAEAVNTINLLAVRKDVSADEIDMFMNKYGQNCPVAYKALKEIAEAHGYHDFADHPLGEQAENVQILAESIDSTFNAGRFENGNAVIITEGFCANVEQAFPAE